MIDIRLQLNDMLGILKKARSSGAGTPASAVRPTRDWMMIRIVFSLLLAALLSFDVWMYIIARTTDAVPPVHSGGGTDTALSAHDLDATLTHYAGLQKEHQRLLSAPLSVPDPAK